MTTDEKNVSGSLFAALNGESDDEQKAFHVFQGTAGRRLSLEKRDGRTFSIAYMDIRLVRYEGQLIHIFHGQDEIVIKGSNLHALYYALHEERANRILERVPTVDEHTPYIEDIRLPESEDTQ